MGGGAAQFIVPLLAGVAGGSYPNIARGASAALSAYGAVQGWRQNEEERKYRQAEREREVEARESVAQYLRSRTMIPQGRSYGDILSGGDTSAERIAAIEREQGSLTPELSNALSHIDLETALSFAGGRQQKAADRMAMPATPQDAFAQLGAIPKGGQAQIETRGGATVRAEGEPFYKPAADPRPPQTITDNELAIRSRGGRTGNERVDSLTPAQAKAALNDSRPPPSQTNIYPPGYAQSPSDIQLLLRAKGKKTNNPAADALSPEEAAQVVEEARRRKMKPTDLLLEKMMGGGGGAPTAPARPSVPGARSGRPRTAEELLGQ